LTSDLARQFIAKLLRQRSNIISTRSELKGAFHKFNKLIYHHAPIGIWII
jgi:hypothetical protein